MSSGMLLLAGLFATGPASAAPAEEAPMPRAKSGRVAVEFRVDLTPRGLTFGAGMNPIRPQVEPIRIAMPPMCELAQCPADRAGPPPEVHFMMLQALEQMAGPSPARVQMLPAPAPMPAPTAWSTPAQLPMPPHAAWVAPVPAAGRTMPVGVWTREVGPVSYKLEFNGETLVATTSLIEKGGDGKTFTVNHVLTADWYPTRTEHEIVGVVRGFDIVIADKTVERDEVSGLLGSLADIQKQLNGKPIALTCRVSDGGLLIGDVRLPALKENFEELSTAFAAMGGNYKAPTMAVRPTLTQVEYSAPLARPALPPMPLPRPLPRSNPFRNGGY